MVKIKLKSVVTEIKQNHSVRIGTGVGKVVKVGLSTVIVNLCGVIDVCVFRINKGQFYVNGCIVDFDYELINGQLYQTEQPELTIGNTYNIMGVDYAYMKPCVVTNQNGNRRVYYKNDGNGMLFVSDRGHVLVVYPDEFGDGIFYHLDRGETNLLQDSIFELDLRATPALKELMKNV